MHCCIILLAVALCIVSAAPAGVHTRAALAPEVRSQPLAQNVVKSSGSNDRGSKVRASNQQNTKAAGLADALGKTGSATEPLIGSTIPVARDAEDNTVANLPKWGGLPAGWPAGHFTEADCYEQPGSEDADFTAWCLSWHASPDKQQAKLDSFNSMLASCKWTRVSEYVEAKTTLKIADSFDLATETAAYVTQKGEPIHEYCTQDNWVVNRVGPMEPTTGNYTWSYVKWVIKNELSATGVAHGHVRDQSNLLVTGFFGGPTDESMAIVGYPPVHLHHSHLSSFESDDFSHEIFGHGDDQCLESQGGQACHIQLFPEGVAAHMIFPLGHNMEFNDVRPANSTPLTMYGVVAIRLASSLAEVPRRYAHWGNTVDAFNAMVSNCRGYANTYVIPGNVRSALWDELYVYTSFRVQWGWFHLHAQWAEAVYVYLDVTAEELGLATLLPHREILYIEGGSYTDGVNGILQHVESQPYIPMCVFKRSVAPYDSHYGTLEAGTQFFRRNSGCRPVEGRPGMRLTTVAVYSPSDPSNPAVSKPLTGLHAGPILLIETNATTHRPNSVAVGTAMGLPAPGDGSGILSWLPNEVAECPYAGKVSYPRCLGNYSQFWH